MMLRSGLLTALLWALTACVQLPSERRPPPPQPSPASPAQAQTPQPTPAPPSRPASAEPASLALVSELARVAGLSPEQRRRELGELDGARLDDARRFQLAALLEREDSVDSLERCLKLLNGLGDLDARSQVIVDLMKKSLKARIENRQLAARNAELHDRLEQIKALEKTLQQRSAPVRTP